MGSNRLPFGIISGGYSCSEQYDWQHLTLRQREQATWEQPHRGANVNNPVHTLSRTERTSLSVDRGCDHAEGADEHIHATVRLGKVFQFDQGSSTQNASYQEERFAPTYSPVSHFPDIDEARHRAYVDSICTKSKPVHTSAGRSHHRDEVSRAHTKKPFDTLHSVHPAQLELSQREEFHDRLDISRNCRSKYRSKMLRTTKEKRTYQKNNSYGSCISAHGRNHRQARYRDQLSEPKAKMDRKKRFGDQLAGEKVKKRMACKEHPKEFRSIREQDEQPDQLSEPKAKMNRKKRFGDQLAGEKAKKRMACKEHPKEFRSIREQDDQPYLRHEVHCGGSDVIRNVNREGKAETTDQVGHNGAKGSHLKNILTAATCCGSTKSTENSDVLSPKYSSKTIASPNGPKQSEGSSNMKLESDQLHSVFDCTGNTAGEVSTHDLQHLPATHTEKDVHTKQSDSNPSELLRECLDLWRSTRRLRKETGSEAEKVVQSNQIGTASYKKSADSGSSESDDGNIDASASPSGISESPAENETAFDNSENCISATSPAGLQKRGEGRAKTNPEQPFKSLSGSNCNKSSAKQGLTCNLEVQPEPKPGEITKQNKEAKIPCCMISTAHPDAMVQSRQNSCSDTSQVQLRRNRSSDASKVDQALASHPDSSGRQKFSQHKAVNSHLDLDSRRKYKLGAICEIKRKAEGDGAELCEQTASLTAGQETVAVCLPNEGNQGSETTPFSVSSLDKGTKNSCPKKHVGCSCGSDCRDIKLCSKGGDCRDMPLDTMNGKRNKQMSSELGDSENNIFQEVTEDDYELPEVLEVPLNEQISLQSDADITHSGVAKAADSTPRFAIPDLNCSPSMTADQEVYVAPEEVINQVTGHVSIPQEEESRQPEKNEFTGEHVSIPQDTSQSFSGCSGTAVHEEQSKQTEKNEFTGGHVPISQDTSQSFSACSGTAVQEKHFKQPGKFTGVCEREIANGPRIAESHIGPQRLSCVAESTTSSHAFRFALGEFIKSILKPLWEEGLLSRDVHKLIVKKAVDKVTLTLGPKVPRTEAAIRIFLTEEESLGVKRLVQGYLDVYLGRQVLKRIID